jgi:starch synthase
MAAGVPVVASRVGGLTEVVEDGVTGLLVENRAEQIAAAMNAILQNPSMAASFREQGRLRFERLFTLPIVVAKTIEVYKEVIACGRS